MQSKLFSALPVFLALSGCSEEIQAQDQARPPPGEIRVSGATELPSPDDEADAPDVELRNPVGLD